MRSLLLRLITPSRDALIQRANAEMRRGHLLRYRNYEGAVRHYQTAQALLRKARGM